MDWRSRSRGYSIHGTTRICAECDRRYGLDSSFREQDPGGQRSCRGGPAGLRQPGTRRDARHARGAEYRIGGDLRCLRHQCRARQQVPRRREGEDHAGLPPGAGNEGSGRDLRGHSRLLALGSNRDGPRGGQACLRGKALRPHHSRRPCDGGSGGAHEEDSDARHAAPLGAAHHRSCQDGGERRDRPGSLRPRLEQPERGRHVDAPAGFRPAGRPGLGHVPGAVAKNAVQSRTLPGELA